MSTEKAKRPTPANRNTDLTARKIAQEAAPAPRMVRASVNAQVAQPNQTSHSASQAIPASGRIPRAQQLILDFPSAMSNLVASMELAGVFRHEEKSSEYVGKIVEEASDAAKSFTDRAGDSEIVSESIYLIMDMIHRTKSILNCVVSGDSIFEKDKCDDTDMETTKIPLSGIALGRTMVGRAEESFYTFNESMKLLAITSDSILGTAMLSDHVDESLSDFSLVTLMEEYLSFGYRIQNLINNVASDINSAFYG